MGERLKGRAVELQDSALYQGLHRLARKGWVEADAEALRQFGDLDGTRVCCARECSRALSKEERKMWWDDPRQDLAYGLRGLRRTPT